MWTASARHQHSRGRYATDVTDAEFALIEPLLAQARRGGRRPQTPLREVLNALLYLRRVGCLWRMLPREFPPPSTSNPGIIDSRSVKTNEGGGPRGFDAGRKVNGRSGSCSPMPAVGAASPCAPPLASARGSTSSSARATPRDRASPDGDRAFDRLARSQPKARRMPGGRSTPPQP